LGKTRLAERARIYCVSVDKAMSFLDKEYNIIIMDPPYANHTIGNTISRLADTKLVGKNTTVVVTHSPHLQLDSHYQSLELIKERRHGDSVIAIYHKMEETA